MNLAEMNWMQVEEYLKNDDRLILVVGAVEQHGYLSLATDTLIPMKMAGIASQNTGVPVAPPLSYGCSPYFIDYPGTLSIRLSTLMSLVEDVVSSAYHQGFRKFLVLNGHGGNSGIYTFLYELTREMGDMRTVFYSWWTRPLVPEIAEKHGLVGRHANWMEAFPETIISEMPERQKEPPGDLDVVNSRDVRKHYGDGSFGGRYQTDQKVMDEIIDACTAEIIELLKFK